VERAHLRALSTRDGGAYLSGAVRAGWSSLQLAAGLERPRGGHLPLPGQWRGVGPPATWPHDLAHRGVYRALSAPRAGTGHPGGAIVWAVRAHQACDVGHLPRARGAMVGGSARGARLADGLQPAGCGASGTLSRVWATAGLPRADSTVADSTPSGGGGMSHQQGVRPGRLRAWSALTPRQSWPGTMQGSDGRLELTLSSPPYRPLDALSGDRRGLSRVLGWYKFHRTEVLHSVRG
jgi:hypothetical protein